MKSLFLMLALASPTPGTRPDVPALPAPKPMAAPAQADELVSGMRYVVTRAAPAGARPIATDFVRYRLSAWSADGRTRLNGQVDGEQVRPVKAVAKDWPGLARALLVTPVGETRRWWFGPERMAGAYPGAESSAHVLELTVLAEADPVPVPKNVGAPPPDAVVTASGLAYQVLSRGDRSERPDLDSVIEIDYVGWTRDGVRFDSSLHRGERARFPLRGLIAGWQEGVQLMSPGDSFRFWIPGRLAYDGIDQPGVPKGMLVFDITLHGFEPAGTKP